MCGGRPKIDPFNEKGFQIVNQGCQIFFNVLAPESCLLVSSNIIVTENEHAQKCGWGILACQFVNIKGPQQNWHGQKTTIL